MAKGNPTIPSSWFQLHRFSCHSTNRSAGFAGLSSAPLHGSSPSRDGECRTELHRDGRVRDAHFRPIAQLIPVARWRRSRGMVLRRQGSRRSLPPHCARWRRSHRTALRQQGSRRPLPSLCTVHSRRAMATFAQNCLQTAGFATPSSATLHGSFPLRDGEGCIGLH